MLHKQGFDTYDEVERCVLEPNGTFYVESVKPSEDDRYRAEMQEAVRTLTAEVRELRLKLNAES